LTELKKSLQNDVFYTREIPIYELQPFNLFVQLINIELINAKIPNNARKVGLEVFVGRKYLTTGMIQLIVGELKLKIRLSETCKDVQKISFARTGNHQVFAITHHYFSTITTYVFFNLF